ncbi:MAG: nickel pincer cofactor biosynthesis protein LarC [Acidobacteriota bacterium]
MRTLYFDCFAGASGNMILGALIAAGVEPERLEAELRKLDIADFELVISRVDRSGISSVHVDVRVPHEHVHRHLSDIEAIIDRSVISESVRRRAKAIFKRLASAEAKIHGIDVNKVHFHEVGAMDAIVDVVGACIGFEMLGIERFACSRIHVGSGFAQMAHGKFPVPPPAVAELLSGIPIYSTEIEGELITPTGAAIIATLCDSYGAIPEMQLEHAAYGAGTREYSGFPNVLRLMIGTTATSEPTTESDEKLILIETNIDDLSPQILGFVMERAFELGARDCWFTPIQMKKNRPATMVSILCKAADQEGLSHLMYTETTTIGLRKTKVDRECLGRRIVSVSTRFGPIDVKVAVLGDTEVNAMPEYDQVKKAAVQHGVPYRVVRDAVLAEIRANSDANTAKA